MTNSDTYHIRLRRRAPPRNHQPRRHRTGANRHARNPRRPRGRESVQSEGGWAESGGGGGSRYDSKLTPSRHHRGIRTTKGDMRERDDKKDRLHGNTTFPPSRTFCKRGASEVGSSLGPMNRNRAWDQGYSAYANRLLSRYADNVSSGKRWAFRRPPPGY